MPSNTLRSDQREWRKLAPGLWWQVGSEIYKSITYEDGQERKKHYHATNETEAKNEHEKRRVSTRAGTEPATDHQTVDELAADFWTLFEGLVASGEKASTTLDRYQVQYRKHIQPTFGRKRVQRVRPEHVSRWLADLRRQGLDVASIYSILSVLLNHAVKRNRIVESPLKRLDDRERPKRRSKNPSRCLTDAECSALIANSLPSTHDLIAFYAFTGVRQSEGLGLVWDDFDFEAGGVKIRAQLDRKTKTRVSRLKSERGRREIDLLPELVAMLKHRKAEAFQRGHARPEDFVFATTEGRPLSYRNVTRDLGVAADRAKLNEGEAPKLSTHDLRHTTISRWIAAGLDPATVARMAGDDVNTILTVYVHEFERAKRQDEIREKLAAGTSIKLA